jgi:hypothetical protein
MEKKILEQSRSVLGRFYCINFHESHLVGVMLLHVDRQTVKLQRQVSKISCCCSVLWVLAGSAILTLADSYSLEKVCNTVLFCSDVL